MLEGIEAHSVVWGWKWNDRTIPILFVFSLFSPLLLFDFVNSAKKRSFPFIARDGWGNCAFRGGAEWGLERNTQGKYCWIISEIMRLKRILSLLSQPILSLTLRLRHYPISTNNFKARLAADTVKPPLLSLLQQCYTAPFECQQLHWHFLMKSPRAMTTFSRGLRRSVHHSLFVIIRYHFSRREADKTT